MNQDQALKILIEAVAAANLKGAFSLQDSVTIGTAVAVFTNPQPEVKKLPEEVKPETPSKKKTK